MAAILGSLLLTFTCDQDTPHGITPVATTTAPVAEGDVTPLIHQALLGKELLPAKHMADTAHVDAELLVRSRQEYGVDLIGPTRPDYQWQAKPATGFAASAFPIDGERQQAVWPEGPASVSWTPAVDRGSNEVIQIKFSAKHCQPCPSHTHCTRPQRRMITVRTHDDYRALQTARQRETTEEFRQEYGRRAAVEGTISQGARACGLRRSRQVGKAKTHLQYVATAEAINVLRIRSWRMDRPRQRTRTSVFAKLMVPKTAAEEKNRHLRKHPLLSPNLHCSLTRFFSFRELLFQ